MKARLSLMVLAIGLLAAWLLLDASGRETQNGDSPLIAARYHARNRTSQFFQRSGQQGRRSVGAAIRTGESMSGFTQTTSPPSDDVQSARL